MRRAFEVGVLGLVIVALVVTSGQGAVIDVSGRVVDRHGAKRSNHRGPTPMGGSRWNAISTSVRPR
jgi:hypothetical protein